MSNRRLLSIKKYLRTHKLTHLVISDPASVQYLSGFHSSHAFLLISSNRSIVCTDFRYLQGCQELFRNSREWRVSVIKGTGFSFLSEYVHAGDRLGIQSNNITLEQFDQIKKEVKKCTFDFLGKEFSAEISSVKTDEEIASMAKAAAIGDKAFKSFIESVAVGMTELEARAVLEKKCEEFGSEKESFDTILLFGAAAAQPHGRPSRRKLRKNDLILCDFGCTFNGFCSDMTRTFFIGKAPEYQKELYAIVAEALKKAKQAIRAGILAGSVDEVARSIIEKAGYGQNFGHSTGHGVGLKVHESPRVGSQSTELLQENMVVTVEPGIYLPENTGIRIEDMVVVTKQGCRVLTKTGRDIIEL
ncbi:MAG: aminopeptidase P family protein [Chitinivibrionales bacterium]|nr:aminopeptidase P family protein [Chitinivibrionales bacterium]